jgi:hypothetical protein
MASDLEYERKSGIIAAVLSFINNPDFNGEEFRLRITTVDGGSVEGGVVSHGSGWLLLDSLPDENAPDSTPPRTVFIAAAHVTRCEVL